MPPSSVVVAGLSPCLRPDLVGKTRGFSSVARSFFTPERVISNPRVFGGVRDLLVAFLLATPVTCPFSNF